MLARARSTKLTISLRKSFGLAMPGRLLDLLELGVERRAVEALAGLRIAVVLFLDPAVGERHIAVEDVLPVFGVRLEVRGLDFLADELGVPRREVALDVLDVAAAHLVGQVLAREPLLEHVHEVDRVGRDLGLVVVEHRRQDLVGEARRQARHALVRAGVVAVLLQRLGLGIDVLQRLAVVDAHLGIDARVLGLLQPRQHRELRHHVERARARTAPWTATSWSAASRRS